MATCAWPLPAHRQMVPIAGIGPATSPLPRECSATEPNGLQNCQKIPTCITDSQQTVERETGIEPASLAWKARVLPLNYSRIWGWNSKPLDTLRSRHMNESHHIYGYPAYSVLPIENAILCHWWRGLDSNQRTRKRADLQSAAINHSATSPRANRRLCHVIPKLAVAFTLRRAPHHEETPGRSQVSAHPSGGLAKPGLGALTRRRWVAPSLGTAAWRACPKSGQEPLTSQSARRHADAKMH